MPPELIESLVLIRSYLHSPIVNLPKFYDEVRRVLDELTHKGEDNQGEKVAPVVAEASEQRPTSPEDLQLMSDIDEAFDSDFDEDMSQ